MNIMEKMEAAKPNFTKTDHRIYELVKAEPQYITRASTASITEDHGLSQAALTRFSQKLGYNGYNEFKYELSRQLHKLHGTERTKRSRMEVYIKNERACLLDTGDGFGNLGEYVKTLTDKPVFVVLTHGHVALDVYNHARP